MYLMFHTSLNIEVGQSKSLHFDAVGVHVSCAEDSFVLSCGSQASRNDQNGWMVSGGRMDERRCLLDEQREFLDERLWSAGRAPGVAG